MHRMTRLRPPLDPELSPSTSVGRRPWDKVGAIGGGGHLGVDGGHGTKRGQSGERGTSALTAAMATLTTPCRRTRAVCSGAPQSISSCAWTKSDAAAAPHSAAARSIRALRICRAHCLLHCPYARAQRARASAAGPLAVVHGCGVDTRHGSWKAVNGACMHGCHGRKHTGADVEHVPARAQQHDLVRAALRGAAAGASAIAL